MNLDTWNEDDDGSQEDAKCCLCRCCTIAIVLIAVANLLSSTEPWTLITFVCVVSSDLCTRSDDSGVGGHCKVQFASLNILFMFATNHNVILTSVNRELNNLIDFSARLSFNSSFRAVAWLQEFRSWVSLETICIFVAIADKTFQSVGCLMWEKCLS